MRCYAQNFWRVLGGSVDPEVEKVGKEQFDHSSPITKSKLVYTNNFNYFGKSLKTPPDEHPSLEPSTPKVTHCHCICARYISLSSIHSVCIMLFILFPLIRRSYIYICCAPWLFLLTTTWHHWMMSHQYCFFTTANNPVQGLSIF
jgi:hypothetical protein